MRWDVKPPKPGPCYGDRRTVVRFAFLPHKTRAIGDSRTFHPEQWIWLERIVCEERFSFTSFGMGWIVQRYYPIESKEF